MSMETNPFSFQTASSFSGDFSTQFPISNQFPYDYDFIQKNFFYHLPFVVTASVLTYLKAKLLRIQSCEIVALKSGLIACAILNSPMITGYVITNFFKLHNIEALSSHTKYNLLPKIIGLFTKCGLARILAINLVKMFRRNDLNQRIAKALLIGIGSAYLCYTISFTLDLFKK